MGDIADGLIDGTFDSITGEYLGEGPGYPRTTQKGQYNTIEPRNAEKYAKSTKTIRKELYLLIKQKHEFCSTEKEKRVAVNDARQEMNTKYGKGWREQI